MTEQVVPLAWIATDEQEPPIGVFVLGAFVHRYINAPWAWCGPFIFCAQRDYYGRIRYGDYQRPEVWAVPVLPELPERSKEVV